MFSKAFAYSALALSIYIIVICSQTLVRINEVEKAKHIAVLGIAKEKARGKHLHKTIVIQNTDDYLESLSRKRLGLVKPGEVVYKIVMKE